MRASDFQSAAAPGGACLQADIYRQEAFRLGDELWRASIRDRKGRPAWLGMDLGADGKSFHFGLIGNSSASQCRRALTGLSHGAAGMAAALARLAQASGHQSFAEAARRAVADERSVFVNVRGKWPDFRSTSEPNAFILSWCHGSPGILLSRHVLRGAGLADEQTDGERQSQRRRCRCPPVSESEAFVISQAQAGGGYTFRSADWLLQGLLTQPLQPRHGELRGQELWPLAELGLQFTCAGHHQVNGAGGFGV